MPQASNAITKFGDTGISECPDCGTKFFHVYGKSSHVCDRCGHETVCGVEWCRGCLGAWIKEQRPTKNRLTRLLIKIRLLITGG